MELQGLLSTLLQAVLTVVVPIVSAHLVSFINKQAEVAQARQENEAVARYISEISMAVTNAVLFTSQTYTDEARRTGSFDIGKQKQALALAIEMAKGSLTVDALDFISMAYGDLQAYLTLQIEAEVKAQKGD